MRYILELIAMIITVSVLKRCDKHNALIFVLRKNQLTSPFFIDLEEKELSTSWQAIHQ
ncbi:hypothetical protein RYX36_029445, partial [Vicia faba]